MVFSSVCVGSLAGIFAALMWAVSWAMLVVSLVVLYVLTLWFHGQLCWIFSKRFAIVDTP